MDEDGRALTEAHIRAKLKRQILTGGEIYAVITRNKRNNGKG